MDVITVLGADWCEDTQASRELLDAMGIPYRYVDIDADPEAMNLVRQINGGRQKTPTILFPDGRPPLVEPSDAELAEAVRASHLAV